MKTLFISFAAIFALSGCVSTVTTYDGTGKKLGSCEAQNAMFFGVKGSVMCTGTANGETHR